MSTFYLTVPGITNSAEAHWQSVWERKDPGRFMRIEQDEWNAPDRHQWTAKINEAVRSHGPEKVVLVAHSLGCIAVNHWAGEYGTAIKAAMLVAPSDCETDKYRATFNSSGFDPVPLARLPFPSVVVASTNDEWISLDRALQFANAWGSEFVNVGAKGHINAASGFGEWDEGLEILKKLD